MRILSSLSLSSTSAIEWKKSVRSDALEEPSMQGSLQSAGKTTQDKKVKKKKANVVVVVDKEERTLTSTPHGQRIALEKEVLRLQKKLRQEVDIRRALERAFRRRIGSLPRTPLYLPPKTQELLAEVAVLEEEVVKLEDQILNLHQGLYEEALYTLSPKSQKEDKKVIQLKPPPPLVALGDNLIPIKTLAQSKGNSLFNGSLHNQRKRRDPLVSKLLPSIREKKEEEEEISNLSLGTHQDQQYGEGKICNRIENSVNVALSLPNKGHEAPKCGEVVPNGAETPTIDCHMFEGKAKTVDLNGNRQGKISKLPKHGPQRQYNNGVVKISTPPLVLANRQQHSAAAIKDSNEGGASQNGNTTEPNKLSEEMVKCLVDIYLKLTRPAVSDASPLSSVSFSSYNTTTLSQKSSMDISEEFKFPDLHGTLTESVPRDIGAYKNYYNITTVSFDYSKVASSSNLFKRLSCQLEWLLQEAKVKSTVTKAFRRASLRVLVHQLSVVDLQGLTHQQKLAFWINIYNVCMMHAFLEHGIPCSPHKVVALMGKAVLNVGGHLLNALAIEHFILRLPSHPKHSILKDKGEREVLRSAYGLEWPEPLVSFALCCGSHSSPAVHVYTASEVESELETAKKEYLQAAVEVVAEKKKVLIPKLLVWYMKDFAKDVESLIEWICEQLPSFLRNAVQNCLQMKTCKTLSEIVEVVPYDFNFRYLLASHPL